MLLFKHVVLLTSAILLLSIFHPTVSAQQSHPGEAANKTTPTANAPAGPTPEAAAPQNAPPVSDKSANDRLAFMAESERENQNAAPSATGLLFRTLGALLLIIGLIVAAAWGMKRFGGARFGAAREDAPELAILNSVSLGERRSMAIVRFGNRTLLVGSTAQTVTLLAETRNEEVVPRIQSVAEILSQETSTDFSAELNSATDQLAEADWQKGEGVQW